MGDYFLTDGGHVLIAGATGARDDYGGKTVLANWWADQLVELGHRQVSLFVNVKEHSFVRGREVSTLRGAAQSYRAGYRRFDWRGNPADGAQWAEELPGEAVIVWDEAWDYSDSETLHAALRMWGNQPESTRSLVVSQRPYDLSQDIRNNTTITVWVGPVTNEGEQFFDSMKIPDVSDRLKGEMKPYHWAVIDGGELQEVKRPVPEAYA